MPGRDAGIWGLVRRLHDDPARIPGAFLDPASSPVGLSLGFTIPLCTWLLMGFDMSIPIALEDSAFVAGCSRLGARFRIILLISRPWR